MPADPRQAQLHFPLFNHCQVCSHLAYSFSISQNRSFYPSLSPVTWNKHYEASTPAFYKKGANFTKSQNSLRNKRHKPRNIEIVRMLQIINQIQGKEMTEPTKQQKTQTKPPHKPTQIYVKIWEVEF